MEVPNAVKTEYTVIDVQEDEGTISLLTENGDTKDDLNLPGDTDDDKKLVKELVAAFEDGKSCVVTVLAAMEAEKVVGFKEVQ
jgi:translation initiation factor 5A